MKNKKYNREELIEKLEKLEIDKAIAIKEQQYEKASMLRDEYRKYNTLLEDLMNSHD